MFQCKDKELNRTIFYVRHFTRRLCLVALAISTPVFAQVESASANADIIKLVRAGIPEAVILSKINASRGGLDTSSDALVALKQAGGSDAVLNAMIAKSKPLPALSVNNKVPSPALVQPIKFKNADVEFISLLISSDLIRVNVSLRNKSQNSIYLWNGSERDKICQSVSLTDDLGSDFKCASETLYAFGAYNKGDQGKMIEPGSSLAFQYVFDRIGIKPGLQFSFSTSPFLTVAKPPQDILPNAFGLSGFYNVESLGITFTDVTAKVRPAAN